jgi:Na+/proline symporter
VNEIVVAMTVLFVLYSFIGGLVAVAWTDFFQGFLIIALSFMLIPLGWGVVGGMDGMRQSLAAPNFTLAAPQGIGLWYIFMLMINGLVGILAQPHMLAAVGTGRDEQTCRIGFFWGNFIKRICTVGWAMVGLMVAAMLVQGSFGVNKLTDTEEAFGFACRHLLFPGALGLMIACVLAANMSTGSAFMVNSGALFTEGLYRRHWAPGRPDKHYLLAGRLSGLLITLLSVVYALFFIDKVLYSFLLTETMATYMGIGLLGGIIWRRANRWGALASPISAFATNFIVYHLRGERLDHWNPTVFCAAFVAGVAALIIVSLLTKPEPAAATAAFFTRLDTPTELPGHEGDPINSPNQRQVAQAAAECGRQSLIVHLLNPTRATHGVPFWRAYRTDLAGFLRAWIWVLLLVALTWLMLRL